MLGHVDQPIDVADVERPGKRRGLGLLGIRERVSSLGGTVLVESASGRGSRIHVSLQSVEPPRVQLDPALVAALVGPVGTEENNG